MHRFQIVTWLAPVWLLLAGTASAHEITLKQIRPRDGATVSQGISGMVAMYSAPVSIVRPQVTTPSGKVYPVRVTTTGPEARFELLFEGPGTHVYRWQVPQADGHMVSYTHRLKLSGDKPTPVVAEPSTAEGPAAETLDIALATGWARILKVARSLAN